MTYPLQGTDVATASTFLKDATVVTMRDRLLMDYLDREGRINKNATGKDLNWRIQYKLPVAQTYVPGQPLSFANDNFNLSASVVPTFWYETSGMNFVDITMNSGPTAIVDNYMARTNLMLQGMQVKLAKDLYSDNAATPTSVIGLNTLAKRNVTTAICTNADRLAVPLGGATYAGLTLSPGSYGGGWSNLRPTAQQMSTVLGSDWPDGQGTPDQIYDCTTPRLYNFNTNQWVNAAGAAPANGTWATNCIAMLSRANTDMKQVSVRSMMPTIHISGADMHQAVKDQLRVAFRDTQQSNKSAETLGYYNELSLEGAIITQDHECPADRLFSVCSKSMDLFFYGDDTVEGSNKARMLTNQNAQAITGGIYTVFGPTHVPATFDWAWMMIAGGNARYNPRWFTCMKDYTTGV